MFIKDPEAAKDYTWPWGGIFADDAITAATVTTTGGLVAGTPTVDGQNVTVRISGGTVGTHAEAVCHVTTASGQTDDWTERFWIEHR